MSVPENSRVVRVWPQKSFSITLERNFASLDHAFSYNSKRTFSPMVFWPQASDIDNLLPSICHQIWLYLMSLIRGSTEFWGRVQGWPLCKSLLSSEPLFLSWKVKALELIFFMDLSSLTSSLIQIPQKLWAGVPDPRDCKCQEALRVCVCA